MKNKKAEANTKSVKTANNKIKKVEDQTMKGKGKEKEELDKGCRKTNLENREKSIRQRKG